mgnify:CR=1 FL=1
MMAFGEMVALQSDRITSIPLVEAKRLVLMGRMAAGVSHELNNLLGKIIGLAEMTRSVTEGRAGQCGGDRNDDAVLPDGEKPARGHDRSVAGRT